MNPWRSFFFKEAENKDWCNIISLHVYLRQWLVFSLRILLHLENGGFIFSLKKVGKKQICLRTSWSVSSIKETEALV